MRLWLLSALIALFPLGAPAQVPPGEYVRNYSPGYAGESLTITVDSAFVRHHWFDTEFPADSPGSVYLGDAGALRQSGATLALDYRHAVLDSAALAARDEWSEPVGAWVNRRLENQRTRAPSLVVGQIDGTTALAWAGDAGRIGECARRFAAWTPEDRELFDDSATERRAALREACGSVFLTERLMEEVSRRAGTF